MGIISFAGWSPFFSRSIPMSLALAPTTELDAVNEILAAIGEAPVSQLTNLGLQDAAIAQNRLYDACGVSRSAAGHGTPTTTSPSRPTSLATSTSPTTPSR